MSTKKTSDLRENLPRDRLAPLETALADAPARNLTARETAQRANSAAAGWARFAGNDSYRRALAQRDTDLAREIATLRMPQATEAMTALKAMATSLPAETCRVLGEISGSRPAGIRVALVKDTGTVLAQTTPDSVGQYAIDTQCTDKSVTLEIHDGAGRLLLQDGSPIALQQGMLIERNYTINRCGDLVVDAGDDTHKDPVMPNLVGQPRGFAERVLDKLGSFDLTFDYAFDTATKDYVTAQDPADGQPLPDGTAVILTLSRGPEPVEKMPDLIGKTMQAARKNLTDLPFKGLGIDYVDAPDKIGKVVRQEPSKDAPLGPETEILLCVGQVRKPMPNVIGKPEDEARALLVPDIADTVSVAHEISKKAPGTVIAQVPEPRTAIAPGIPIAITLAKSAQDTPAPQMPDVRGLTRDVATAKIDDQGDFKIAVKTAAHATPKGQVFEQDPDADSALAPGDAISFTVSTGPAPKMPKLTGLAEAQARAAVVPKYAEAITVAYVDADSPGGTVTAQLPPANSALSEDTKITIDVSKPAKDTGRKTMPDLAGLTAAQAKKALAAVGITKVEYDAAQARRKNFRVITQRPASGRVLKGTQTATLTFGEKT